MKAVVAAFNQEKALVGAFSVITNLRMELFQALSLTPLHGVVPMVPPAVVAAPVPLPPVSVDHRLGPALGRLAARQQQRQQHRQYQRELRGYVDITGRYPAL